MISEYERRIPRRDFTNILSDFWYFLSPSPVRHEFQHTVHPLLKEIYEEINNDPSLQVKNIKLSWDYMKDNGL